MERLQLCATGIHFRRAAFIDSDMGFIMAIDRAVRRRHDGEGQSIRCGAGDDGKSRDLALEDFRQMLVQLRGPLIGAIGAGGMGTAKELNLEHWFRDLRTMRIVEGASEIHRYLIARDMLGSAATGRERPAA